MYFDLSNERVIGFRQIENDSQKQALLAEYIKSCSSQKVSPELVILNTVKNMKIGQEYQEKFDFTQILQEHQENEKVNEMITLTNKFKMRKLRRRSSAGFFSRSDSVLGGLQDEVENITKILNPMNLGENVKKLGDKIYKTGSVLKTGGKNFKNMFTRNKEEDDSVIRSSISDKTVRVVAFSIFSSVSRTQAFLKSLQTHANSTQKTQIFKEVKNVLIFD